MSRQGGGDERQKCPLCGGKHGAGSGACPVCSLCGERQWQVHGVCELAPCGGYEDGHCKRRVST